MQKAANFTINNSEQLIYWWQTLPPNWKYSCLYALGYLEYQCLKVNDSYLQNTRSFYYYVSTQRYYVFSLRVSTNQNRRFLKTYLEWLSLLDIYRITQLQHLTLWKCNTLEPILILQQLKSLSIAQNPITDLSPLVHLSFLEHLNCTGTLIRSLAPLRKLSKLSFLDIRKCTQLPVYEILEWLACSRCITFSDIQFNLQPEKATQPIWEDKNSYGILLFALAFILTVFVTQLFRT
ncbi:MAG: leucine-rich repeat domain-containing protein [Bacteroidia bacterium]|nr:leucine-rich repeat domain-containing protein [Bacteroidia bacterium]MDW8158173.1 leucine-rich repeat domain-containing protein [Bacteroidia bacterium]